MIANCPVVATGKGVFKNIFLNMLLKRASKFNKGKSANVDAPLRNMLLFMDRSSKSHLIC